MHWRIVRFSAGTIQKETEQGQLGQLKFLTRIPVVPHSPLNLCEIFLQPCPEVRPVLQSSGTIRLLTLECTAPAYLKYPPKLNVDCA